MNMPQLTISLTTIFRIVAAVLVIWFLYVVREVIILLLIAIIITASLGPIIGYLERWKLPRGGVVALVYIAFFALVSWLVSSIVPAMIAQTQGLADNLQVLLGTIGDSALGEMLGVGQSVNQSAVGNVGQFVSGSFGEIFARTASVFSSLIAVVAVISMSFYMSLQKNGMRAVVESLTPAQYRKYAVSLVKRIQESFGRWMAGQVVTMVFVGILYFIALSLLGVPYAGLLAVIGGLLEIVPYMGPILAVIPAALIGFTISPAVGFAVVGAYTIINLVENHLLIPQIMHKAVGLNPVVVIVALLMGAKVAGLAGIILAVPIAGAIAVFARDVMDKKIS